ncbi:MAG: SDR family NAD(P)-dependent oxidoreductase [Pseudonocardia sp.]
MAADGLPDLTGFVALVTGAGGGIGVGIAERFAVAGAAVVVHYRTSAERAAMVTVDIVRRGGRAVVAQADVTDADECASLMDVAFDRFGRLGQRGRRRCVCLPRLPDGRLDHRARPGNRWRDVGASGMVRP